MCNVCLDGSEAWGELALEMDLGNVSPLGFINTGRRRRCSKKMSARGS